MFLKMDAKRIGFSTNNAQNDQSIWFLGPPCYDPLNLQNMGYDSVAVVPHTWAW